MKVGFDSEKYISVQRKEILNRLNCHDRIYLEFGGKMVYDMHASRVLPGYKKTSKIELIKSLGDIEVIYCVNAKDLVSLRYLGDFDLSYSDQVLKDLKDIEEFGVKVNFICITRYEGEEGIEKIKNNFEALGHKVVLHKEIENYEKGVDYVLEGYSKEEHIPVSKKIIIVTGVAGGSAKMSIALNQIYLEKKEGINSGFAKFETFPIWNLSLDHPINLAYEAATADLGDYNVIDKFYKEKHGVDVVNYNRDLYNFEILKKIDSSYSSPTEMGVNMAKEGIVDDAVCREAALEEIRRRWKVYSREFEKGREDQKTLDRMKEIMAKAGL
jgi:uncharacterized protein (UPF0371 family)